MPVGLEDLEPPLLLPPECLLVREQVRLDRSSPEASAAASASRKTIVTR
jgi:hypothetical protein